MKLSVALRGYWLTKELEFSERTTPGYRRTFARLVAFLGDVDIEAVASADIRRFLLHLRADYGLGRRSVSDAWVPLSSLWSWAENEFGIPHIIRGKVKRPPSQSASSIPSTNRIYVNCWPCWLRTPWARRGLRRCVTVPSS